jgi:hypothetical protein
MSQLRKRLENLEAAMSPPDGRPFVIWARSAMPPPQCAAKPTLKFRSRSTLG